MIAVFLSLLAFVALALTAWLEWRAHRRVRPVHAREITPDAVRYLMTRQDGDR